MCGISSPPCATSNELRLLNGEDMYLQTQIADTLLEKKIYLIQLHYPGKRFDPGIIEEINRGCLTGKKVINPKVVSGSVLP